MIAAILQQVKTILVFLAKKSCFYSPSYGYVTTQIIGGRMTELFGVKRVYGFCLLGTAFLTLLSPIAAKLHVAAFIALRVLQGGKICRMGPSAKVRLPNDEYRG